MAGVKGGKRGQAHTPVVGDPFDALEEIEASNFSRGEFQREDQGEHGEADEDRRRSEASESHERSEKPRATFVALGLERVNGSLRDHGTTAGVAL